MTRDTYQRQLRGLRQSVIELGVKVHRQLELGLQALLQHDLALADKLDAYDDAIDQQSLELEKLCLQLLALQQPVATDLRLITSSFKIATDLERVADLAVNLGEYARDCERIEVISPADIEQAGGLAADMLAQAMQAYEHKDEALAIDVIQRDRELDLACWGIMRGFIKQLVAREMQSHTEEQVERITSQALTVLLSMRDLERIGDHAVNTAARVVYIASGSHQYI